MLSAWKVWFKKHWLLVVGAVLAGIGVILLEPLIPQVIDKSIKSTDRIGLIQAYSAVVLIFVTTMSIVRADRQNSIANDLLSLEQNRNVIVTFDIDGNVSIINLSKNPIYVTRFISIAYGQNAPVSGVRVMSENKVIDSSGHYYIANNGIKEQIEYVFENHNDKDAKVEVTFMYFYGGTGDVEYLETYLFKWQNDGVGNQAAFFGKVNGKGESVNISRHYWMK